MSDNTLFRSSAITRKKRKPNIAAIFSTRAKTASAVNKEQTSAYRSAADREARTTRRTDDGTPLLLKSDRSRKSHHPRWKMGSHTPDAHNSLLPKQPEDNAEKQDEQSPIRHAVERIPAMTKYGTKAIQLPDITQAIYRTVAKLPEDFPFDEWDDMNTFQQRKTMEATDLTKEEQWDILNARLPIGTLRQVQEIQTLPSRSNAAKTQQIKKLWDAGSAIYAIKNHDHPLSYDRSSERVLSDLINEEIELLRHVDTRGVPEPDEEKPEKGSEADGKPQNSEDAAMDETQNTNDNGTESSETVLPHGKLLEDGSVDLTDDLLDLMRTRAKEFDEATKDMPPAEKLLYMIDNVKTGGIIDIKNQEEWKQDPNRKYFFNGMELRKDDGGNILFGYVLAKHYSLWFLKLGAGAYQIIKGNTGFKETLGFWKTNFDDPRDQDMIEYGYQLYLEEQENEKRNKKTRP